MQRIKVHLMIVLSLLLIICIESCSKKEPVIIKQPDTNTVVEHFWRNRGAQDFSYRKGKWYSITDGTSLGITNTLLDSIWFLTDSFGGWTGFVDYNPHAFAFRKTYFKGDYYIIYEVPDPADTTKVLIISHECGMTATGDTFAIYWDWGNFIFVERYLKLKE